MRRLPGSPEAQRIAALFRRRLTTPWDEKEVKRFRALVNDGCFKNLHDLALLERYYASERKKPDNKGWHKRDLYTFLNQYRTELDRANEWALTHPVHKPRKIIPLPPVKSEEPPIQSDPEALQRFRADFKASRGRDLFGA